MNFYRAFNQITIPSSHSRIYLSHSIDRASSRKHIYVICTDTNAILWGARNNCEILKRSIPLSRTEAFAIGKGNNEINTYMHACILYTLYKSNQKLRMTARNFIHLKFAFWCRLALFSFCCVLARCKRAQSLSLVLQHKQW